jgi:hypothetical protein
LADEKIKMFERISDIALAELKLPCSVENVAMDGNCLFSSIALQLGRRGLHAGLDIRREIVEYIGSHRDMVIA